MAVAQTHNKLPGTNIPFPSLPSHHIKTLASVVMSAKGVRFLLTSNRQSRASKASQGVQPQVRGFCSQSHYGDGELVAGSGPVTYPDLRTISPWFF